ISQRVNNGFSNFINENPTLLNVYLERTFLKHDRAAVRIQGYDLFNENTGLSHDVYGNDIYETRNSRLGRYFLVSFNYRLQRFAGVKDYYAMKAQGISYQKPGDPSVLSLSEVELPPCRENEVLIRVVSSGINKPDVFQRNGHYPAPSGFP